MQTKDWLILKSRAEQAGYWKKNFPGVFMSWCRGVPIMVGALLLGAGAVDAASLGQQTNILLQDACKSLIDSGANLTGTKLGDLCAGGAANGGSGSGAGAAATQTTPGVVQERLLTARGEDGQMSDSVSELLPGLSVFLSGEYESLDKDLTVFEDGYDSDIQRFTLGGDYQFTDKVMAGLAFTYYNQDGDFDGSGDFDNDSYGVTFFASILPIDQVFVQLTAGYAAKDYDRTRIASFDWQNGNNTSGAVSGDYEGDEYSAGILAGYDYTVGNLSIGPRLGLDYIRTEFDSYTETGSTGLELTFADADQTSLQSRLGLATSLAFSTGFGVLQPQAGANWVHEFENDQRSEAFSFKDDLNSVAFLYENEGPDRDFFEFTLGVSAVLPHGWLPFVQFRVIAGHEYLDSYAGTIGLRKEF